MGKVPTPVCVLGKQTWLRAGRSAFTPLTQKQNLRWEAEGGTSGLEAWNCPHGQPHMPQLGADWSFAGSRVSPGPCSELIAQISGNESQPVQASEADGTHWGQLAEKALQRNPGTSDRWKEPEADEDVLVGEGEGGGEKNQGFRLETRGHLVTISQKDSRLWISPLPNLRKSIKMLC